MFSPMIVMQADRLFLVQPGKATGQVSALGAIEYIRERYLLKPTVQVGGWALPVGHADAPIKAWYCASTHLMPQPGGTKHYGIDLNWEKSPRGDVDFGQPVWAVTHGEVYQKGHSAGWVYVIVIKHWYTDTGGNDMEFYMRYAHLGDTFVKEGDLVEPGQMIGRIGNYVSGRGGDHLHLDCAWRPFNWNQYRTPGKSWFDPIVLFKEHIDPAIVDSMVRDDKNY